MSRNASPRAPRRRQATGTSFLVIFVVATAITLVVTLWTIHSVSERQRGRGIPSSFRI
ncbi:MAG TPA: hypothetical protein VHO06_08640 [Polyangia bacterium]|nr:hypothetical protein [Polyangia bacterium]